MNEHVGDGVRAGGGKVGVGERGGIGERSGEWSAGEFSGVDARIGEGTGEGTGDRTGEYTGEYEGAQESSEAESSGVEAGDGWLGLDVAREERLREFYFDNDPATVVSNGHAEVHYNSWAVKGVQREGGEKQDKCK